MRRTGPSTARMCGIAGIFGIPDRAALARMVAALRHRGPNDSGEFADHRAALGSTRLAIIDLSDDGHQPMKSEDGDVVLVFNGEIYNYREERAQLEAAGHRFRSHSDTEVILALYLRYGSDFVRRLRGIFAIAIYDRRGGPRRERLILARDHFGIKPLIYVETPTGISFASELKALIAADQVSRDIDPVALQQLLIRGSVRQPRTILAQARMLPAAHMMVLDHAGTRVAPYWSLATGRVRGMRKLPYSEVCKAVKDVIARSVEAQLVADVPVGAFLSGGIDSSLLVALIAARHSAPLQTYSISFDVASDAPDEGDDAMLVARHLGTKHRRVVATGADFRDNLEKIGWAIDQPSVDGVNTWFVAKAAAAELKVAISGTGGDEWFAGYPWFAAMAAAPRRWWRDDFVEKFATQYAIFGNEGAVALLARDVLQPDAIHGLAGDLVGEDVIPRGTALERTSGLVVSGYTRHQLLRDIDAMSMAHSLEVRVPFMDPEVADIALSIPDSAKLAPGPVSDTVPDSYRALGAKRVLLDIGRPLLPPGFDQRPKRGFTLPIDRWLHGPAAGALAECLSPSTVRRRGWFDPDSVALVMNGFREGTVHWTRPWLLMLTELWAQSALDGAVCHGREAGRSHEIVAS
jgi:asparagine synthase (glutamine-hydrolysing)